MTYHLSPGEGTSYVFDITTGEIISQFQPLRWTIEGFVCLLIGGAVILWFFWKRKPEPPPPQLPRDLGPLRSFRSA
jgi:hypothetical protein